jgi:hypothetical protein
MADTIVGAHNGSFKDSGAIGMSEIRDFLVNRDGVSAENYAADNLPGSISLQKLYNVSQQNEIELSAAYPSSNYNLGGFYGSNYTNNTPPVISLLGPSMFVVNTDAPIEYTDFFTTNALIGTSWEGNGSGSTSPNSNDEYYTVVIKMKVEFTSLDKAYVWFSDILYFYNEYGIARAVSGTGQFGGFEQAWNLNWWREGNYIYFNVPWAVYGSSYNSDTSWIEFEPTNENIENNLIKDSGWADTFPGKRMYTLDYEYMPSASAILNWKRIS